MSEHALRSADGGSSEGTSMKPNERALWIVTGLCVGFLTWLSWAMYGPLGVAAFWLIVAWNFSGDGFPGSSR